MGALGPVADCSQAPGAVTIKRMRGVCSIFLLVVVAGLVLAGPASAQVRPRVGADIVTMTNGDVHHGTVAQEDFHLVTPYGRISVPFARIYRIIRTGRNEHRILTAEGERFTGRLDHDGLPILRVLEAPLVLEPNDVGEIEFAPRPIRMSLAPMGDAVEMQNGDVFRARFTSRDLLVTGDFGLSMVSRDTIHFIDVEAVGERAPARVCITLNTNGRSVIGSLASGGLSVILRHGQAVSLPSRTVATLAVGVMAPDRFHMEDLDFTFRRRVNPWGLIRDSLRDGMPGPEMVIVRGGAFQRGDRTGGGDPDERPVKTVTLSRPFAIGLYEITFDQYDRFCRATRCDLPEDEGWGRGRRPVINVSWEDASAYAAWLSEQTGQTYRLPTDAEWEYAARAGTTTRFWWGEGLGEVRANCAECGSLWDGEKTARVGKFPPNPFGLHDTAGNVFEWVADCWHDSFSEAPTDGTAVQKNKGCGKRVIRGGAWSFPPKEMRSANRWRDFPTRKSDDTGFRLVRELKR